MRVVLIFCLMVFAFASCKKKGCTNPTAINYSSEAEKDDGSCNYGNLTIIGGTISFDSIGQNNTAWDSFSYPDTYLRIEGVTESFGGYCTATSNVVEYEETVIENDSELIVFNLNESFQLSENGANEICGINFILVDLDTIAGNPTNSVMLGEKFLIVEQMLARPTTWTHYQNNCTLTLNVQWTE